VAVSTGGNDDDVMSTINITPFTDVLLVLLIIFIILASVTKEPKLPDAKNKDLVQPSQIIVFVNDKNQIEIGSNSVTVGDAHNAFAALQDATGHRLKSIIIKANPKASYGVILQVMDAAKSEGLIDFGLANHIEGTPEGQSS
jgi:biopolymer transport protein TolR